jgi:uncharacterized protein YoxC
LFIAGIAVALFILNQKLTQLTDSVHPLIEKANTALQNLETLSAQVGERVNVILDQTGHMVETVTEKVETTTSIAEEAIAQPRLTPAITLAAPISGWETFRAERAQEKGDSRE